MSPPLSPTLRRLTEDRVVRAEYRWRLGEHVLQLGRAVTILGILVAVPLWVEGGPLAGLAPAGIGVALLAWAYRMMRHASLVVAEASARLQDAALVRAAAELDRDVPEGFPRT